jgi:hypothetical protein
MQKFGIAAIGLAIGLVCFHPVPTAEAQETPLRIQKSDSLSSPQPRPEEAQAAGEEGMTQEELLESLSQVHGRRGRRLFKTAYWAAGLEGDMRTIYDTYGYPSSRYREVEAGVTLEKWTYLEDGKQFIFRDGKLMRTSNVNLDSDLGIYLK